MHSAPILAQVCRKSDVSRHERASPCADLCEQRGESHRQLDILKMAASMASGVPPGGWPRICSSFLPKDLVVKRFVERGSVKGVPSERSSFDGSVNNPIHG